jgi:hypothetical protein
MESKPYNKSTRKQVNSNKNNNPSGKGGFGENPQNRHHGAWRKEETARGILEAMMKLSDEELIEIKNDKEGARFKRTVAEILLDGEQDTKERWKQIKELVAEVYGTPKQALDVTTNGDSLTGLKISFEEASK